MFVISKINFAVVVLADEESQLDRDSEPTKHAVKSATPATDRVGKAAKQASRPAG